MKEYVSRCPWFRECVTQYVHAEFNRTFLACRMTGGNIFSLCLWQFWPMMYSFSLLMPPAPHRYHNSEFAGALIWMIYKFTFDHVSMITIPVFVRLKLPNRNAVYSHIWCELYGMNSGCAGALFFVACSLYFRWFDWDWNVLDLVASMLNEA